MGYKELTVCFSQPKRLEQDIPNFNVLYSILLNSGILVKERVHISHAKIVMSAFVSLQFNIF